MSSRGSRRHRAQVLTEAADAYQRAGGIGAPMFECYALRLEVESGNTFVDLNALIAARLHDKA